MFTRDSVIISRNIKTPLTSISRAVGNILQLTYGQLIKSLFSNGEQGFVYDPNDLSTMYQDAAGTVPVTGAGQAVGVMLDKSKGLALGVEQFPTFDFNNWTSVGGVSTKTSNSITTTSLGGVYKPIPLGSGRVYAIKISGWSSSGGMVRNSGNSNGQAALPVGDFSVTIISPSMFGVGAVPNLYIMLFGASSVRFDSLSVKELSGNHAYQTTSSMRPLLVASPQRLDFDIADDKLITELPTQLTGCTVIRAVPNVGTQILTNQTIPTPHNDNTDHCGLIVINRALTASETSQVTKLFNKAAGV